MKEIKWKSKTGKTIGETRDKKTHSEYEK